MTVEFAGACTMSCAVVHTIWRLGSGGRSWGGRSKAGF